MNILISMLGAAGLLACYEVAYFHMTAKTRHSIRAALIVVGIGCALASGAAWCSAAVPVALAFLLAGCGLYRIADRRQAAWHERGDPGGVRGVAGLSVIEGGRADDGGQAGDGVHRPGLRAVGG